MTTRRLLLVVALLVVAAAASLLWYMLYLPGRSYAGPPPPLSDLDRALAERLRSHVTAVASVPHNVKHYAALQRSASYIEAMLTAAGYAVGRQVYEVGGREVRNIEAVIEPMDAAAQVPSLVIGAHYDSYGDAPGANDNGTGTAAVLELARLLKDVRPRRLRLRFVLFVNEEPPYFQTADMGSWRYARRLAERGEPVKGMLSLETLGAFSSKPGSQRYPFAFNIAFPTTADFIAFVAMPGSRGFLHDVVGSFRRNAKVASIGGVAPDVIPGIGWSDHWSFAQFGFPAVMVTDTALFRYTHYHTTEDTPDKVDYDMLARITAGLARVVREFADNGR